MNDLSSLGTVLQRHRERLGLGQAEVGRRAGLSQQAIAKWEADHDEGRIRFERLGQICDALGVRPYDVLEEAGVLDGVSNEQLLPLQRHLAWRVTRLVDAGRGGPQDQLKAAELLRKLGRLDQASASLDRLINDLAPLLARRRRYVELAALLFEAYDLQAAVTIERLGRLAFVPIMGLCDAMERLAEGTLAFDRPEYLARAQFRRADAHLVANDRARFARGAAIAARCAATLRDPDRRLNALRIQAGLARRSGDSTAFDAGLMMIRGMLERDLAAPATISLVYQGLAGNLAAQPRYGKGEAVSALQVAYDAYAKAAARTDVEDTHLQALLHRTAGHLAALCGPGCDLERAEAELQQGLDLAVAAGRSRTAAHCEGALRQVREKQPLTELPL